MMAEQVHREIKRKYGLSKAEADEMISWGVTIQVVASDRFPVAGGAGGDSDRNKVRNMAIGGVAIIAAIVVVMMYVNHKTGANALQNVPLPAVMQSQVDEHKEDALDAKAEKAEAEAKADAANEKADFYKNLLEEVKQQGKDKAVDSVIDSIIGQSEGEPDDTNDSTDGPVRVADAGDSSDLPRRDSESVRDDDAGSIPSDGLRELGFGTDRTDANASESASSEVKNNPAGVPLSVNEPVNTETTFQALRQSSSRPTPTDQALLRRTFAKPESGFAKNAKNSRGTNTGFNSAQQADTNQRGSQSSQTLTLQQVLQQELDRRQLAEDIADSISSQEIASPSIPN